MSNFGQPPKGLKRPLLLLVYSLEEPHPFPLVMPLESAAAIVSRFVILNIWTVGILLAMLLNIPGEEAFSDPKIAAGAIAASGVCFGVLAIWLGLGTGSYRPRVELGLQSPREVARRHKLIALYFAGSLLAAILVFYTFSNWYGRAGIA